MASNSGWILVMEGSGALAAASKGTERMAMETARRMGRCPPVELAFARQGRLLGRKATQ
jgi:hypothetical protein